MTRYPYLRHHFLQVAYEVLLRLFFLTIERRHDLWDIGRDFDKLRILLTKTESSTCRATGAGLHTESAAVFAGGEETVNLCLCLRQAV